MQLPKVGGGLFKGKKDRAIGRESFGTGLAVVIPSRHGSVDKKSKGRSPTP